MSDSSELVIDTSTIPLGPAAQIQDGALGSLIMGEFGGGASVTGRSSYGYTLLPFVGEGGMLRVLVGTVMFALVVCLSMSLC